MEEEEGEGREGVERKRERRGEREKGGGRERGREIRRGRDKRGEIRGER